MTTNHTPTPQFDVIAALTARVAELETALTNTADKLEDAKRLGGLRGGIWQRTIDEARAALAKEQA